MWKHSFWHSETCKESVWYSTFYSNSAQGNARVSLDTYVKRDTDLNMDLQSPSFQNEPLCKQEKRVGKVHLRRRKLFSVSDVCAVLEGSCTLPPSDTGTRKSLPTLNPRTKKSEGSVNVSNPHLASSHSENFLSPNFKFRESKVQSFNALSPTNFLSAYPLMT